MRALKNKISLPVIPAKAGTCLAGRRVQALNLLLKMVYYLDPGFRDCVTIRHSREGGNPGRKPSVEEDWIPDPPTPRLRWAGADIRACPPEL